MIEISEYKQKLTDYLSDEYSYSKQHNDFNCMVLIEEVFLKMDLDNSAIEFINS